MATLSEFLRTGRLGPIVLGVSTSEALQVLGDPEEVSKKSNPALLKYGPLELTFWKKPTERVQRLRDIVISCGPSDTPMPTPVDFTDWRVTQTSQVGDFNTFIGRVDVRPMIAARGLNDLDQVFPSGVVASFAQGRLTALRLMSKEVQQSPVVSAQEVRQTPIEQIRGMLAQADQAFNAGASAAALLMTWAAAEATLRRIAARAQIDRKVMLQPPLLIHHLRAAHELSAEDAELLERIRQLRSAHAHGFPDSPIAQTDLVRLRSIVLKLLGSLATSTPD